MDKINYNGIISKLDDELSRMYNGEKYSFLEYKDIYEQCLKNYSKICSVCLVLEKNNLPYDCLQNSSYCIKNKNDLQVILKYEELSNY